MQHVCGSWILSCSWFFFQTYQRAKSDDLEDRLHEEKGGKHDVEVLQDVVVGQRRTVELWTRKENKDRKGMRSVKFKYGEREWKKCLRCRVAGYVVNLFPGADGLH